MAKTLQTEMSQLYEEQLSEYSNYNQSDLLFQEPNL